MLFRVLLTFFDFRLKSLATPGLDFLSGFKFLSHRLCSGYRLRFVIQNLGSGSKFWLYILGLVFGSSNWVWVQFFNLWSKFRK
jgi:hypothetical protein